MSEAVSTKIAEVLYFVIPLVLFVLVVIAVGKSRDKSKTSNSDL